MRRFNELDAYNISVIAYKLLRNSTMRIAAIELLRSLKQPYLSVRLDTNNRCNLRCIMCTVPEKTRRTKREIMPLSLFEKIGKEIFPYTRVLYLSCLFEPFLTPNFEDYLRILGQYNIPHMAVISNGTLLNESIATSMVAEKISTLTLSIDGATKETYKSIRIGADFDKVMSNVDLLNEIKERKASEYPKLRFNFTILPSNYHEIPEYIRLCKTKKVSEIQFRSPMGVEIEQSVWTEIQHLLRESKKEAADSNMTIFMPEISKSKTVTKIKKKMTDCVAPWYELIVTSDGKTKVCNKHRFSIGDFKVDNFAKMRQNRELTMMKSMMRKNPEKSCKKDCNFYLDFE